MARGEPATTTDGRPRGGSLPTLLAALCTQLERDRSASPGAAPAGAPVSADPDSGRTDDAVAPSERGRDTSARRRALPAAADGLPPLGAAYHETVARGLMEMGLRLGDLALAAIHDHARLLMAWNQAINLTAIRDPEAVARLHVLDSLSALVTVPALSSLRSTTERQARGPTLLDLGSGGGYPGIPLAVALPAGRTALVDAVIKKARFLEVAAAAVARCLEPSFGRRPTFEVLAERAEDLAHDEAERERWDLVTARAVGSLTEVLELALPLLRVGGQVLVWKREGPDGALAAELRAAGGVARSAGGGRLSVHPALSPLPHSHRIVSMTKVRSSPGRFPRPPGLRRRHSRA